MRSIKVAILSITLQSIFSVFAQAFPLAPSLETAVQNQAQVKKIFLENTPLTSEGDGKAVTNSKRERADILDTSWFAAPGDSLALNLFADAQYIAVIDKVEMMESTSIFFGHIQGNPERRILMAYNNGVLAARIHGLDGRVYGIYFRASDGHRVYEIDEALSICNGDPTGELAAMEPAGFFAIDATAAASGPSPVVDVMILYSAEALALYSQSGIDTKIALGIAYINNAFYDSGVNARIRLIHKRLISWHTQAQTINEELNWLKSDPTVANYRNTYGADLVSEIHSWTFAGGQADSCSITCSSNTGFSVFDGDPHTLGHELAHGLGCGHERGNIYYCVPNDSPLYYFGRKWTPPAGIGLYSTIMAYGGKQIDQFSSPLRNFLDGPTGLPEGSVDGNGVPNSADNARRINESAPTVAACKFPNINVLSSPELINNDTQFTFYISGPNNASYVVDYTRDYVNWIFLGNYQLSGGRVQVTDNISSDLWRFYRAREITTGLPNQVGYIKISAPVGQSMIANHIETGNNTLASLIPSAPDGTQVWKFDEGMQVYVTSTFRTSSGSWSSPNMTVNPGEGCILKNFSTQPIALKFVGEVHSAFYDRVPTRWAIRSSPAPQAGLLSSFLGYTPIDANAQAQKMTGTDGTYTSYTWNGAWTPQQPTIAVGEAFWTYNPSTAVIWSRTLWIWP